MRFWIKCNSLFLLLLTVYRVFFILQFRENLNDSSSGDLLLAFLTGVRFDAMVIGFANLPLLPFLKIKTLYNKLNYYFSFLFLAASFLTSIDHLYFLQNQDRVNKLFLFPAIDFTNALIMLAVFIPAAFANIFLFRNLSKLETPNSKKYVLIILLTAIAMRGSLGQHHLDLRHSQISNSNFINLVCINSLYAWDQALRSRR